MQVFVERLRAALDRDERITQEAVSDRAKRAGYALGVNEVSKIRTGATKRPGPIKVAGLAVGLAVSADWLLGISEDPGPGWELPQGPILRALEAAEKEAQSPPATAKARPPDGRRSG